MIQSNIHKYTKEGVGRNKRETRELETRGPKQNKRRNKNKRRETATKFQSNVKRKKTKGNIGRRKGPLGAAETKGQKER